LNYELLFLLLLLGGFVGVMAGLLGIGGGLIVVPALLYLLPQANISTDVVMHIALATSLASIIITSGSSAYNHLKLGNVNIYVIKWLLPGVILGGFIGSYVTELIPSEMLPNVFGSIVLFLALQMLISVKSTTVRAMPGEFVTSCSGCIIGIISTLAGIGGGSLTVPYLNRYGVEMRKAVGSSSVCGCVIALSGMTGFIWHGIGVAHLPDYSVGYVYTPALIAIVSTSVFTTKIGARWATRLPTAQLKKVFALFLLFIAGRMLLS